MLCKVGELRLKLSKLRENPFNLLSANVEVTSLVAAVAPRASKIIENGLNFLKEDKICYKMVYCDVITCNNM